MRIVSWNCNGALRKKFHGLKTFDADIYIIQECENPQLLFNASNDFLGFSSNFLWNGDNKNKGLGVFTKPNILIEPFEIKKIWRGRELKWFLPFIVNGKTKMLGVWTHKADADAFPYIGQFWNLLQQNKETLVNTIIVGDFNSNSIWDHWDRWWNHTDCVSELERMDIYSVYHSREKVCHGNESRSTFFLHKKKEKGFHIDYIFSPSNTLKRTIRLQFGEYLEWITLSDHVPIIWEYEERET